MSDVVIVLGSTSDARAVEDAGVVKTLGQLGLSHTAAVVSAHRNSAELHDYTRDQISAGAKVFIGVAGMAAALPGALAGASGMSKPVIAVPLDQHGVDSCLYMPPGVPVLLTGVGQAGLKNAAVAAAQIIAAGDRDLGTRLREYVARTNKRPQYDVGLGPIHTGKVRDTYAAGNNLLMVASDRLSVFDVVLNEPVPGKGQVLTAMTEFWLRHTPIKDVAPNHLISADPADYPAWARQYAGRALLVRRAVMLPIECIVRGYLVGSGWREYKQQGTLHGQPLPPGMREGDELPEPQFTPSTKAELGEHDENITYQQAEELVGAYVASQARRISLEAYKIAAKYAKQRGILLLDTKFELGWIDGQLSLCDEILTPDSSRFVDSATHEPGRPPKSMDKEYVRQWAMSTGWDKTPPPPPVPADVIARTAEIYTDIQRRLTGPLAG